MHISQENHLFVDSIPIVIRRSMKAKQLMLKRKIHHLEIVIPKGCSIKIAQSFLNQQHEWIKTHHAALLPITKLSDNSQISLLGQTYTIKHSGKLRGITQMVGQTIIVSGDPILLPKNILRFFKKLCLARCTYFATYYKEKLGVEYNRISVKDMHSRYGSCSNKGNLNFNWRLILTTEEILAYVVIHELCHLIEMNHSTEFWRLVESLCPQYKDHKSWLKKHGDKLFQYYL